MVASLAEMRTAIRDYLNRADLTDLQVDNFIDNGRRAAAAYLAREQEASVALTLDAALSAALPARFLAARMALLPSGESISERGSVFNMLADPGYQIISGRLVIVGDTSSQVKPGDIVTLHYYEFPEMLTASVTVTPYLLANADLWMWAACEDGARFLDAPSLRDVAGQAIAAIGPRVRQLASHGRQWGGPRRFQVRV